MRGGVAAGLFCMLVGLFCLQGAPHNHCVCVSVCVRFCACSCKTAGTGALSRICSTA